jgi:hypothetical protein
MKTDREVVLEAAQIIRDNGFGKRKYYNEDTNCYCLSGAIRQAVSSLGKAIYADLPGASTCLISAEECRQMNRIKKCINMLLRARGEWTSLISWNDEAETTREDVLALLEQAAEAS